MARGTPNKAAGSGRGSRTLLQLLGLAVLSFGNCTASAATIPTRIRPGLWQAVVTMSMRMTMNGQTEAVPDRAVTMVNCSDGSLGRMATESTPAGNNCTTGSTSFSGNTLNVVSVCPVMMGMSGALTTHVTLTFESVTRMHMMTTGVSPNLAMDMTGDWNWVGACPAGVTPGETGQMVNGNFEAGSGSMAMPQAVP